LLLQVNTTAVQQAEQATKPEKHQRDASPSPGIRFDVDAFTQQQAAEARTAGELGPKGGVLGLPTW
jgi:hypothetical protein